MTQLQIIQAYHTGRAVARMLAVGDEFRGAWGAAENHGITDLRCKSMFTTGFLDGLRGRNIVCDLNNRIVKINPPT